jgi:type II secretory pathway pseudopilin PulG
MGFSYLWLIFAVALFGVALAAVGEQTQINVQREQEDELLYRGAEIEHALLRYRSAVAGSEGAFPKTLQDLVEDMRSTEPRYHLRRLYLDPFTGRADWELIRNSDGRIVGVHSRSSHIALGRHAVPATIVRTDDSARNIEVMVSEWHFLAAPAAAASAGSSSQAVAR